MTTRLFALPAILATMFALSACSGPDEPAQAPEPRVKGEKSKAELLIGKWKLVKHNVKQLPQGFESTTEYTQDRRVTKWINNPLEAKPTIKMGRYRFDGDTIYLRLDPEERILRIKSLTEDRLVISMMSGGDLQIYEWERLVP